MKRTPITNPYNFDTYVQWKGDYRRETSKFIYSDRMFQWDEVKFNMAAYYAFGDDNGGQFFDRRSPEDINMFLNKYFEKEVKLTAVLKGCNHSSGYPLWCFIYEE